MQKVYHYCYYFYFLFIWVLCWCQICFYYCLAAIHVHRIHISTATERMKKLWDFMSVLDFMYLLQQKNSDFHTKRCYKDFDFSLHSLPLYRRFRDLRISFTEKNQEKKVFVWWNVNCFISLKMEGFGCVAAVTVGSSLNLFKVEMNFFLCSVRLYGKITSILFFNGSVLFRNSTRWNVSKMVDWHILKE